MAIFRYSSSGAFGTLPSVITGTADAFSSDTPLVADTLIVDAGAFLISTDPAPSSAGAYLNTSGAWTATVNGTVISDDNGLWLEAGNAASSTITIGVEGNVSGSTAFGLLAYSAATINNSGTIFGGDIGIDFANSAHTITNSGTITGGGFAAIFDRAGSGAVTVKNTGGISGNVNVSDGSNTLQNSGTISGNYLGLGGGDSVTNSGTLTGFVQLGDGTNGLTNTGAITGGDGNNVGVFGGAGNETVSNSKTITGSVVLLGGINKLTNSGTIGAELDLNKHSYFGQSLADTVINSGAMAGVVSLGDGTNSLTNSGSIGANGNNVSVFGGTGNDTVSNTKTITGAVIAGAGTNALTNSGTIGKRVADNDSYEGGINTDTVTNAVRVGTKAFGGTIAGDVVTGDGADTVTNFVTFQVLLGTVLTTVTASGKIGGTIDLGDGADRFNGGAFAETVLDGGGADIINLSGGNDTYIATGAGVDGTDIVMGGLGIDTYDASAATTQVRINLDTVDHGAPIGLDFFSTAVAKSTGLGTDVSDGVGVIKDTVTGFENANGGSSGDIMFGSAAANVFNGNGGSDDLWGFAGNDFLNGGAGTDELVGGAGKDILTGGTEGDTFWYFATSESGVTAATRDIITDFTAGAADAEHIELSGIDANRNNAANTNDAFNFIGTNVNWGGVAGQLRAYWTASGQIIEGDTNGDKIADFSIAINDAAHAINFSATDGVDFIL